MYYSQHTLSVLLLMVVTGAARSVTVKLFFQSGLEKPMFVTLLYLFGQSLSLLLYYIAQWWALAHHHDEHPEHDLTYMEDKSCIAPPLAQNVPLDEKEDEEDDSNNNNVNDLDIDAWVKDVQTQKEQQQQQTAESREAATPTTARAEGGLRGSTSRQPGRTSLRGSTRSSLRGSLRSSTRMSQSMHFLATSTRRLDSILHSHDHHHEEENQPKEQEQEEIPQEEPPSSINLEQSQSQRPTLQPTRKNRGSVHGLTTASYKAVAFVEHMPFWQKILIPSIFNLINAVCRWMSLLFVQASIYEILIGGLDLILSVLAARLWRKRQVARHRWIAVLIVALAIVVVGYAGSLSAEEAEDDDEDNNDTTTNSKYSQLIGYGLIVGKCITSVFQDMAEEVFLQTSDIPVLQLLGWEGLFGITIASVVYFPLAAAGVIPNESLPELAEELGQWQVALFALALTLLITVAGIYNILATAETSAVTRNLWKNFRTILVWIMGLILYYATPNSDDIGEAWEIPASFIVLGGFGIMLYGTHVYYTEPKAKEAKQQQSTIQSEALSGDKKGKLNHLETGSLSHEGEEEVAV